MHQTTGTHEAGSRVFSAPSAAAIVIGFACFLTAGMVELNPTLSGGALPQAAELIARLEIPRTLLAFGGLCLVCWLGFKHGALFNRPAAVLTLSILYAAGVALTYSCGYGPTFVYGGVLAGCLLSAASTVLIPLWFEVMCFENSARVILYTAAAHALSFALTVVITDLSFPLFVACTAAMPLAGGTLLCTLRREQEPPAILGAHLPRNLKTLKQVPIKAFLGTAVFGVAILMANSISEQRYSFSTEMYTVWSGLAVALAIALVAAGTNALRKHLDYTLLYRLLFPALVASLLVVMIAEDGFQAYEAIVLGGIWAFYRIATITVWCSLAADSFYPSVSVIAIAQMIQTLLNKVEGPVVSAIPALGSSDTVMIAIIVSLVVFASMFLLNEHALSLKIDARRLEATPYKDPRDFYAGCVAAAAQTYALSQREQELCLLLLEGMPSDQIRAKLVIAPGTFKTHMRNIYGKTDVHSREGLVELLHTMAAR